MAKLSLSTTLAACVCLSQWLFSAQAVCAGGQGAEFDYLIEALDRWHHAPDVYCTFSEQNGTVDDAGPDGYHGLKVEPPFVSGVWVKLGDQVRYERTYAHGNIVATASDAVGGAAGAVRNMDLAELVSAEIGVAFYPHSRNARMTTRNQPGNVENNRGDFRCGTALTALNPATQLDGPARAITRRLEEAQAPGANRVRARVEHPGPGRSEIRTDTFVSVGGRDFVVGQQVLMATDVPRPYPVRFGWTQTIDGEPDGETWIYLDDPVEIRGYPVPRQVVSVGGAPPHECKVWRSDDLGERPPTQDDLQIEIPANAWYSGFKRPIDYEEPQTIRLAGLSLADTFLPGETGGQMQGPHPAQARRAAREQISSWSLAAVLVVVLAAAVLVLVIWRRRRLAPL